MNTREQAPIQTRTELKTTLQDWIMNV